MTRSVRDPGTDGPGGCDNSAVCCQQDGESVVDFGDDRLDPEQRRVRSAVFLALLRTGRPVVEAYAGDPVRLRVLMPHGEQGQVFTVEGHRWRLEQQADSTLVSSLQLGPLEAITIDLEDGAGGPALLAGDYVYGDHREPFREAGLWGLLRVWDSCVHTDGLETLPTSSAACDGGLSSWALRGLAVSALLAVVIAGWRFRRRPLNT